MILLVLPGAHRDRCTAIAASRLREAARNIAATDAASLPRAPGHRIIGRMIGGRQRNPPTSVQEPYPRGGRPVTRHPYLASLAALAVCLLPGWAGAGTRPAVVELFTSQGCSSCPPADALLHELSGRSDVLALGYHINYWDRLGWKDPLSSPQSTERQRGYARQFHAGQVYTPQIVVDGTDEMIGSDRAAVYSAIRTPRQAEAAVDFAADRHSVRIGAGGTAQVSGGAAILIVRFAEHRTTQIGAGENDGRTADDVNGVLSLERLGTWTGTAIGFAIEPPPPGQGVAVLVQDPGGRIVGAGSILAAPAAKPAGRV
jgi:hypothetical protein